MAAVLFGSFDLASKDAMLIPCEEPCGSPSLAMRLLRQYVSLHVVFGSLLPAMKMPSPSPAKIWDGRDRGTCNEPTNQLQKKNTTY